MALRIPYAGGRLGEELDVTVYLFPGGPDRPADDSARALGSWRTWPPREIDVDGTPEEVKAWTTAAALLVRRIAEAELLLGRAQRRIRRWDSVVTRRRARAGYDASRADFLARVRAAAAVYRPVRDVIEARLAAREARARDVTRRAYQEKERRWQEVVARFRRWEARQAVADRPLAGGPTPRELAARGDAPARWPEEVREAVGDPAAWWAGVRASVRNRQAEALALRRVLGAIAEAAAALEAAGRPGIETIRGRPGEVLHGWWIHFDWSDLPDTGRLRTPPDVPPGSVDANRWLYLLHLPADAIFVASRSAAYAFATESRSKIPTGGYGYRYSWSTRDPERFAEQLVHHEIVAFDAPGHTGPVAFPMADHADPDAYVPYVEAVAERAAARFRALIPPQP
ncbi:hypothetical protein ACFWAR_34410 [Streptomyces sp. NPDC059917]|uniref:hypothetical protein n=1 Tax=Streptomyces sp. NPDC059917 TaxID=3347002 RepID=UPI003662D3DA